MKKIFLIALAMVLGSSAFAQNDTITNEDAIYDQVWVLYRMNNKKVNYKENDEKITLVITRENEYAGGSSGCNRYFAQAVIKRNHLLFRSMGSTRMACPEDKEELERTYLTAIDYVDSYKIIDEDLYLYKNDRAILVFRKE